MTKNEERRILEQIYNLINATGKDSYISAAFAGCYEMAVENIDNDFLSSMKEQRDLARQNAKTEHDLRIKAEDDYKKAVKELEKAYAKVGELKKQIESEKQKQLPSWLYRDIYRSAEDQVIAATLEINDISVSLAAYADNPGDIAVAANLKRLNTAINKRAKASKILDSLPQYEAK